MLTFLKIQSKCASDDENSTVIKNIKNKLNFHSEEKGELLTIIEKIKMSEKEIV